MCPYFNTCFLLKLSIDAKYKRFSKNDKKNLWIIYLENSKKNLLEHSIMEEKQKKYSSICMRAVMHK